MGGNGVNYQMDQLVNNKSHVTKASYTIHHANNVILKFVMGLIMIVMESSMRT